MMKSFYLSASALVIKTFCEFWGFFLHLAGSKRVSLFIQLICCLSNRQFERLGGPLDEIVTISVAQIQRHNATS